jgi:hypothetical protein
MHAASLTSLLLLLSAGTAQAVTGKPSGVVEVDLLFPRNETYAPTEYMLLVFAFQNPELSPLIGPSLSYTLFDMKDDDPYDNDSRDLNRYFFGIDLRWANFSSSNGSTYYRHLPALVPGLMTEGSYVFTWTLYWANCTEGSWGGDPRGKSSTQSVYFTIRSGAQNSLDIGSISDSCPDEKQGFAFNVTYTHQVSSVEERHWNGSSTCGEVASSIPKPDPCRAKVTPSAASSISAALVISMCNGAHGTSQVDCPPKDEDSGAPHGHAWGLVGLVDVFGSLLQCLAW